MSEPKQRVLITVGAGYGNMVFTSPLIRAVVSMGYKVSVLAEGTWADSYRLFEKAEGVEASVGKIADLPCKFTDYVYILRTIFHKRHYKTGREVFPEKMDPTKHHEIVQNMTVAKQIGYAREIPTPFVRDIKATPRKEVKRVFLSDPRSSEYWQRRKYPHFAALVNALNENYDITLIGSAGDARQWTKFDSSIHQIIPANIAAAAEYLTQADLFISQDCGLLQIAAAINVKSIGLFGPTSLIKNHPTGNDVTIISAKMACAHCQGTDQWGLCKDNTICMSSISVDRILDTIHDMSACVGGLA